jgi:hypothetical protein
LHFEESTNLNKSFTAITIGRSVYLPRFRGRAWVATSNGEVLPIETDLVSLIPQIDLQLERMVIEYAPIAFPARQVRLWLSNKISGSHKPIVTLPARTKGGRPAIGVLAIAEIAR